MSELSMDFDCNDVSREDSASGKISWSYGEREEGVVYPGDVEVVVQVNGSTICSDVTDTSCTLDLPRDVYSISITQSNDIGSTVNSGIFDIRVLVVTEQTSLIVNRELLLIVTVRRNRLCPETQSPVLVTFGVRAETGGECEGQQNAIHMVISSGDSASFFVNAADISLGSNEIVCFIVSLDGVPVVSGTSANNASTAITTTDATSCDKSSGSAVGTAVGISVGLTLVVAVPVGVALGFCGMWCLMKSRRGYKIDPPSGSDQKDKRELSEDVYEEPGAVETTFSLSDNQAYGKFATQESS